MTSGTIGIPFYSSHRHVTSDEFERHYQRTLTPHYSNNYKILLEIWSLTGMLRNQVQHLRYEFENYQIPLRNERQCHAFELDHD